jgi:Transposase DDE domain
MANDTPSDNPTRKRSSVRHTRAIQRDRSKRPVAAPPDPQVVERLTELIHPATLAQLDHFRTLGLRERLLTLPVMVALVLTMIWRQIGSVCELVRLLNTEGFLWCSPTPASQQALSQRLLTFPAALFQRVLEEVLPTMHARFQERQRPLPRALTWAQERYTHLLAVDGSTLDALLRKAGLLRELPIQPLAGRMFALLDLCSRLPTKIWYEADPKAHDQRHWPTILGALTAGTLLVLDAGYTNFGRFLQLTQATVTWITRAKSNLAYEVERCLVQTPGVQDALVVIGQGAERQRVRLVQVLVRGQWYRYLTNDLDAERLPALYVAALYAHRWGIEEAYATVKRLLGLAYFWVGSENGVQLQVWATWLLYAVLVDLTDGVAERLRQPLAAVSLEMVYRSLYYFTQAYHRGETVDPVEYLASHAKLLGIVKRKRKPAAEPLPWSDLTEAVRA